MKIADLILNYGYSHDNHIVRKDLVSWFSQTQPELSIRSIDSAIVKSKYSTNNFQKN